MIVCVCRAVCDRKLRTLVDQGVDTVEKIERACGAGGDCGTCRGEVEKIIEIATRPAALASKAA